MTLTIIRTECEACAGIGRQLCQNCNGNGTRYPERPGGAICRECRGSGERACAACDGEGEIETERETE